MKIKITVNFNGPSSVTTVSSKKEADTFLDRLNAQQQDFVEFGSTLVNRSNITFISIQETRESS